MVSARKIHEWLLKALEEPFFRAEMHKVEILLKNSPENKKYNRQAQRVKEVKTGQEDAEERPPEKNSCLTTLGGKISSR